MDLSDEHLDKAYAYLIEHEAAEQYVDPDSVSLRRRIDWYIVPIMFACYTCQFLDKVALNYSAVMGLPEDLDLVGNDFTNAATAFFAAYLAAELINVLALQKAPPAKWLGLNVVLWGIACGAAAGAKNETTLVVARVFLGIFESAVGPCLTLISSQWYRKDEQVMRFSIWYSGLGLGQIIGGLVSYGFQQVQPGTAALAGWRIMFLTIGGLTVIVGIVTFLFLPDSPMQATFLSSAEKVTILRKVGANRTGVLNNSFQKGQVLEVLLDPQIWLLMLITILISISSGVVTTYSATLISLFGFSSPRAALLNTPSGAVTIVSTLLTGIVVRYRLFSRSAALMTTASVSLVGACLLAFVPSPTPLHPEANQGNRPALLAGIYLINCITPTLSLLYAWTASNIAGSTKRVVAICLISGSFGIGNIVSPQTFQARDLASGYKPARVTVVSTQAAAIGVTAVLLGWYWMCNRKRGPQSNSIEIERDNKTKWEGLTDKQDTAFRYVY